MQRTIDTDDTSVVGQNSLNGARAPLRLSWLAYLHAGTEGARIRQPWIDAHDDLLDTAAFLAPFDSDIKRALALIGVVLQAVQVCRKPFIGKLDALNDAGALFG